MIISTFQGQDFLPLVPGAAIFRKFDGSIVKYDPVEFGVNRDVPEAIPFFINEAAYYEKDIAFVIGEKVTVTATKMVV
jgi:aspartoacylase